MPFSLETSLSGTIPQFQPEKQRVQSDDLPCWYVLVRWCSHEFGTNLAPSGWSDDRGEGREGKSVAENFKAGASSSTRWRSSSVRTPSGRVSEPSWARPPLRLLVTPALAQGPVALRADGEFAKRAVLDSAEHAGCLYAIGLPRNPKLEARARRLCQRAQSQWQQSAEGVPTFFYKARSWPSAPLRGQVRGGGR